jgi:hypothetical protein
MKKIGFIDLYLDEWHANNYPILIKEVATKMNLDMEVCYAYADYDSATGLTTDEWCEKNNIERIFSIKELVEKSDAIIVLSPDNGEEHYRLSKEALQSGKPVYIDKTFSFSVKEAEGMFALAKKYNTPMFSTSALRYIKGLSDLGNVTKVETTGGGRDFQIYLVHQIEMLLLAMKGCPTKVKTEQIGKEIIVRMEFEENRFATARWSDENSFCLSAINENGEKVVLSDCEDMLYLMIEDILQMFETNVVPVKSEETLNVVKTIEAVLTSKETKEWISVD